MIHPLSSRTKAEAVLRVLRGDDGDVVAEEFGVSRRRLERWRRDFMDGGQASLERPRRRHLVRWFRKRGKVIAQYGSLLLLLALTVIALTRFMEPGGE